MDILTKFLQEAGLIRINERKEERVSLINYRKSKDTIHFTGELCDNPVLMQALKNIH